MCKSFPGELINFSLTRIHSHIWKKVAVEKGYTLQIYPWQTSCFSLLAMISQGWSSKGFLLKHWVSNIKKKWENWKPSDDHPSPILWLQKNIDGTTLRLSPSTCSALKSTENPVFQRQTHSAPPRRFGFWIRLQGWKNIWFIYVYSMERIYYNAQCKWSSVL